MQNKRKTPCHSCGEQSQPTTVCPDSTVSSPENPQPKTPLHPLLNELTPKDLALVAAGLKRSDKLDEAGTNQLLSEALMLLEAAAAKLAFARQLRTEMELSQASSPPPPRDISGATFLRKFLPGSSTVYSERRREFGRTVMQFLKNKGAPGGSERFQTPAELDEWLDYFETIKLPHEFVTLFQQFATEVKESPKAKQKRAEARRRGGLARTAQQLAKCLTAMGGSAQICDLIGGRRYKTHTLESTISQNPAQFERFTERGLPAVRLVQGSNNFCKHT
jgi:hypothetical protein